MGIKSTLPLLGDKKPAIKQVTLIRTAINNDDKEVAMEAITQLRKELNKLWPSPK